MRISNSNSEGTVLIGKRGFPALGWAGVHKPWVILTLGNEGAGNWQVDQWNIGTDTNAVSISCLQRWACVDLLVDLYPHLLMWVDNDWEIRLMFGCLKINDKDNQRQKTGWIRGEAQQSGNQFSGTSANVSLRWIGAKVFLFSWLVVAWLLLDSY